MSDSRVYFAGSAVQLAKQEDGAPGASTLGEDRPSKSSEPAQECPYLATSPSGGKVIIPKELFVALSDFIKTRKCPGSITIQFRRGEIVCVEAVAKKTYRNT